MSQPRKTWIYPDSLEIEAIKLSLRVDLMSKDSFSSWFETLNLVSQTPIAKFTYPQSFLLCNITRFRQ